MSKKTKLLFGVHLHQPVDNFNEAVDEAVLRCYEPFFATLKKYDKLRIGVHCSGWLLNYIKKNHKKLFIDMKKLAKNGTIELFTAGFYEPVLSSIPQKDALFQIERLSKMIKKEFSQVPKGAWLTERVWENSLINIFDKSGIEYVMVDDYHFISSGFNKDELEGYYLSEEGGKKVALFPINKELRYALPFKVVKEAIEDIKSFKTAIIFDDCEKFGLWPKTFEWVYKKGWLEEFFKAILSDNEIESLHFSEFYEKDRAKGIAYLQNSSYYEMGEWSLKAKDAIELKKIRDEVEKSHGDSTDKFVKGGIWKNFFIKYEESNRLHKRMLELSKYRIKDKKYEDFLYRLQTNDVFWHGVFGGLYLPNLRDNAYTYLCKCENFRYKTTKEMVEVGDMDMDGFLEAKIICKNFIARFESKNGAQMVEFLQRDKEFNYQNTLTRREEAYHKKILDKKDKPKDDKAIKSIHDLDVNINDEIKDALHFDWYIKNSFVDHISNDTFTIENFRKCSFWEYGDFANQPFELSVDNGKVIFQRDGGIYFDNKYDTVLKKSFEAVDGVLRFEVDLKTKSSEHYLYALEFNFHFANLKDVKIDSKSCDKELVLKDMDSLKLFDIYTQKEIILKFDKNFDLLMTPLKTVSQSEKGFDLMTQGVSFAILFEFDKRLNVKGVLEVKSV